MPEPQPFNKGYELLTIHFRGLTGYDMDNTHTKVPSMNDVQFTKNIRTAQQSASQAFESIWPKPTENAPEREKKDYNQKSTDFAKGMSEAEKKLRVELKPQKKINFKF